MTAVQPLGRFGMVEINKKTNLIENFFEKPKGDGSWINGGFFVFPVFDLALYPYANSIFPFV